MSADTPTPRGFRRQVVFRLGLEHWPLLEQAVEAHGSIQAAVLAGLRALGGLPTDRTPAEELRVLTPDRKEPGLSGKPWRRETREAETPDAEASSADEIPAREAAGLLGLKSGTVRGYIRSGRLPGRYDGDPTWRGWLTTRSAVEAYRAQRG